MNNDYHKMFDSVSVIPKLDSVTHKKVFQSVSVIISQFFTVYLMKYERNWQCTRINDSKKMFDSVSIIFRKGFDSVSVIIRRGLTVY